VTPGPRQPLTEFARIYPGIWRIVDEVRQTRRRDDPAWPDYVYLPLGKAGLVLAQWHLEHGTTKGLDPCTLAGPAFVLAGLSAWRVTQGIYRYDPALYAPLIETPVTGNLPGELLRRLPEWCVYLETPGMTGPLGATSATPLLGVWAWLDRGETDILTLMLHAEGAGRLPVGHLPLVGTLEEALTLVDTDWQEALARRELDVALTEPAADLRALLADGNPMRRYTDAAQRAFPPILSLLLYLCSDEPDMEGRPIKPSPKRTKLGWRIFAAEKPRTWNVGERLGVALRRAYAQRDAGEREVDPRTGHARPRAHIRRAHWHTFLTGEGRVHRRLRWLTPIPINVHDVKDLPATVRRVQ
jgi:hypothetical protein